MKTKFERLLRFDGAFHTMRKGEPWDCARVTIYKDNKYISFIITRNELFKSFKDYYRKCKLKLDKEE